MKKIATVVASLLLLPGLAACGQAAEEVAEQALEEGTGGDVEINDDGVSVTDEEGNEWSAGGDVDLPESWPSEVPTPENATLTTAFASPSDDTATAMWTTSASGDEAVAAYDDLLLGSGFTLAQEIDLGIGATRAYTGNGYEVTVISGESDGTTSLTVSVAPSA